MSQSLNTENSENKNILKEYDLVKVNQVKNLLQSNLVEYNFTDEYLNYISEMIIEDPPRNTNDLNNLIIDFLTNYIEIPKKKIKSIIEKLFKDLKSNVEFENSNWKINKLNEAIKMESVKLITEKEEDAGYADTPFSFEILRFHNDFINLDKMTSNQNYIKKKEIEKRKKNEDIRKQQEAILSLASRLPPIMINHNAQGGCVDVKVDSFSLEVSGKVLIEDSKLLLSAGRKYGLIGKNGTGKTTLMYMIAKKEVKGMTTKPQILMIEQEVMGDEKSPLQMILETDGERTQLLEEESNLIAGKGNIDRLNEIYRRLDEIDSNKAESKARTLLNGLGFSEKMIVEPTKLLSGGWRMRVALAKVLFCSPDILLLDEPTNHLDLDAVMWLENYLINFENTLLVVSHAREFLNHVCTDIVNLENEKLEYYRGGFEEFESQREANLERQRKEFENQQNKIDHVQAFIDKFRYNAKRASLVQSRLKYLNRINVIEEVSQEGSTTCFNFPKPEMIRPPIIRIDEGIFGYNDCENLLENLNFSIDMSSKVALLGANGVGKTTLLKILLGELKTKEGSLFINKKARISMFSQHHVEKLEMALNPIDQFISLYPDASNESIRKHLSQFGIIGNLALRPIYLLSGGQKSRVSLAMASWNNPHILIMDEPTNHLDMEAVDALILALNQYEGGILIVSHDQYFVSCVCDEIWYIKNKKLKNFNGDFEAYRTALVSNLL